MTLDVLVEERGQSVWIWINREERRNALNETVLESIRSAILEAESKPHIRAVVLSGKGEKAFCAGADLNQGAEVFGAKYNEQTTDFGRLARVVHRSRLPLIARVNGACVAGGMSLLGLCDLAIAADHAKFGLPETAVGVFPMQVYVHFRDLILPRHFAELAFLGDYMPAARAAEIGLINRAVPTAELDEAVMQYCQNLTDRSGIALKRGRAAMAAMQHMTFDQAMAFAESQIMVTALTDDAREGISAFVEKRKPKFS